MPGLPSGTVTFLFTDIEGSTRLWENHPEAMRQALARHDELLRTAIEAHDGHVFKTIGDAFCAAFYTAPDALNAALAAQQALLSEPWPEPATIKVRMALHTGAAEVRDGDYFGQPLNRVARLLSVGHGRQVLLSASTQELVRDVLLPSVCLQALGEHRLRDLSRPETIFQLLHPDLPTQFPPLKSLDNRDLPNNLPQQLTSFIGREEEITEIKTLLGKTRLLTLTGAGGCGKTRLSLQVAADVLEYSPDGVWLVELAPLSDPALVPQTVASVLGLTEQAGKTFVQTLREYLKSKHLLLVLDNCEHLLAACAQLCNDLLRSCPHLTILASSREGLGIIGEQIHRVPSLSLPDPKETLTIEQVSQFEAVRLFIERAISNKADFAVSNQNAPAIAAVCHRLDGIPLAIELAAARVRSLSIEEINTRLANRFRLLTGGSRTALPRQQTLRALIDWSYDLLNAQEKLLLCRLSVFTGGWTLEAAERVCARESATGESIEEWEVLDLLTSLADKSLVITDTQEPSTRYRMLETVRQYGREHLAESGEGEQVRAIHRDFFLWLAEAAEPNLSGAKQEQWLERLEAEHDNLRQALTFCLEDAEDVEAGLRLVATLWRFWDVRGHFGEGREYLAAALAWAVGPEMHQIRARALVGAGDLAWRQGDYSTAQAVFEESLAICREAGDKWGIARTLFIMANMVSDQGDYDAARALYEESLAICRELEDREGIANCLSNLGIAAKDQGDYSAARALFEESLAICRESGDIYNIGRSLGLLGNLAYAQGDYDAARALFEESLTIRRQLQNKLGIANSLNNLGGVAAVQGDYGAARALFEESLAIRRQLQDKQGTADSLYDLGLVAFFQGDYRTAQTLQQESLAIRRELGDRQGIAACLIYLGGREQEQGNYSAARALYEESLAIFRELEDKKGISDCLDAYACLAHHEQQDQHAVRLWGAATSLREAIGSPRMPIDQESYHHQTTQARVTLGEAAFAAAFEEGHDMTMEQVVAYALKETDLLFP